MQLRFAPVLALAAGIAAQDRVPLTCTFPPFPAGIDPNMCLQANFLSALACTDVNATLVDSATLMLDGWQCCASMPPFAPPPAMGTGLWAKVASNGTVLNRCLGRGSCNSPCPATFGYAVGTCNVTLPPFPS